MATLKVRVLRARDLPIMDRRSQLTDAYVEIRFNDQTDRTPVMRNSLTPTWNHLWEFKVPSLQALQEEPVEFKVYDHDIFSRNDLIGIVFIDLNTILSDPTGKCHIQNSWVPIFDTMRGLRGELELSVRIRFLDNRNPFCPPSLMAPSDHMTATIGSSSIETGEGVLIFSLSSLDSSVYRIEKVAGMVEELLGKADPEYQTIQNFRTSRTTNDARMLQFFRLSGKVRRQLGRKVLELGCNCVLGYNEQFDLERNNGIIIRAYGTACIISMVSSERGPKVTSPNLDVASPAVAPKASKLSPTSLYPGSKTQLRNLHGVTRMDVHLITLQSFAKHSIRRIGGCVSARAVKVITSARSKEELMQERDAWWLEIRDEMKMSARSMRCNAVIGYTEYVSLYEDLCILSASGTAAFLDFSALGFNMHEDGDRRRRKRKANPQSCALVHIPTTFSKSLENCDICKVCRKKYVPEVLLASCEVPEELPVDGPPKLIEARVCHLKKKESGEALAHSISVELPWLESKVHRQLIAKLKANKLNAAFGFRLDFATGDTHFVATATATGVVIPALPRSAAVRLVPERLHSQHSSMSNSIEGGGALHDLIAKEHMGGSLLNAGPTGFLNAGPSGDALAHEVEMESSVSPAIAPRPADGAEHMPCDLAHAKQTKQIPAVPEPTYIFGYPEDAGTYPRAESTTHRGDGEQQHATTTLNNSSDDDGSSSTSSADSMSSDSSESDDQKRPAKSRHESHFLIEMEEDEDWAMYRDEFSFPQHQCICNVEDVCNTVYTRYAFIRQLMLQRRYKLTSHAQQQRFINECFADIQQVLSFKLSGMGNCAVMRYRTESTITTDNELNLILTGMLLQPVPLPPAVPAAIEALRLPEPEPGATSPSASSSRRQSLLSPEKTTLAHDTAKQRASLEPPGAEPGPDAPEGAPPGRSQPRAIKTGSDTGSSPSHSVCEPSSDATRRPYDRQLPSAPRITRPTFPEYLPGPLAVQLDPQRPHATGATTLGDSGTNIILTRLCYVPGATIGRYLGRISGHFLREAMYNRLQMEGGVGAFTHNVHVEANCIIHRLVAAAGGDALLDYTCHHHVIDDNDDKSTSYQFITIMGQVVTLQWPEAASGADPS